MYSKHS